MYFLTESKTEVEGKWYTTYGVGFGDEVIPDITTDKESAQNFIDLINFHKLSPVHIYDAIYDFIG